MAEDGQESSTQRSRMTPTVRIAVICVAAVIVAGLLGGFIGAKVTGGSGRSAAGTKSSCDVSQVSKDVLPAVVTVSVKADSDSGSGSGVILERNGTILTNDHVIAKAAKKGTIHVILDSGKDYEAKLVERDPKTDLAILKVDRKKRLPSLDWGDSDDLSVGNPVVAAGAPLGLSGTITSGVVSAMGRNVPVPGTVLTGAIQTDASINPGNSGGALVTCDGKLVGINTAGATVPSEEGGGSAGSVGIGFAVPASVAKPIAKVLRKGEKVSHPSFGMKTTPVANRTASGDKHVGLRIDKVADDGAGDEADLKKGDIIVGIEDVPELNADTLAHLAAVSSEGDKFEMTYFRDGSQHKTTVTLKS